MSPEMDQNIEDLADGQIRELTQPVLLIAGDSDLLTIEHLASFFRLVGGDVFGDTPAGTASQGIKRDET